jgi:putative salt-induced outer membrane protein
MKHSRNPIALAAAMLWAAAACAAPVEAAKLLPTAAAKELEIATKSRDSAAFSAALRRAIAADPGRKEAILRNVVRAYPEQSAALLMASLYTPSPLAEARRDDVVTIAYPRAGTNQTTVAPPKAAAESVASATSESESELKYPWSGNVVLGATVRTGNTDNAGVTGEGTVRFDDGPWHHRGKAAGDYLRNRTVTQEQSYEAEYEVRYDLDERNFTYGLARYEDDRFSGYDYEATSSAGLGRHLVKEQGHEWTATLGPGFRVAQPSDSESQERAVGARFTNLLSWELSDSAKVENETEAQADRERVRINNDVALKVRLVEQLSAQLSFGFEYRSDAPDDAEHSDTTTRAAIVYDF